MIMIGKCPLLSRLSFALIELSWNRARPKPLDFGPDPTRSVFSFNFSGPARPVLLSAPGPARFLCLQYTGYCKARSVKKVRPWPARPGSNTVCQCFKNFLNGYTSTVHLRLVGLLLPGRSKPNSKKR